MKTAFDSDPRLQPSLACWQLRLGEPVAGNVKLRLGAGTAKAAAPESGRTQAGQPTFMQGYHYVYILESEGDPGHYYAGLTDDLKDRLSRHNRGMVSHTAKYRPRLVKPAIAFRDRDRAAAFERYLKSPSGRAISKKRL